jgi:DNA replication protein DnaD
MSGIFGSSAEDRYYENQLNSWLDRDGAAEQISNEALELAVESVNDPKSNFYYMSTRNIREAIGEITYKDDFCIELAHMIATENLDTAKFLNEAVKKYWINFSQQHFDDELWEARHKD